MPNGLKPRPDAHLQVSLPSLDLNELLLVWHIPWDQFSLGDFTRGCCPRKHSSQDTRTLLNVKVVILRGGQESHKLEVNTTVQVLKGNIFNINPQLYS